jgi:phospholipase A2
MTWLPLGHPVPCQALQQTELYCRARGLPFPRVEISPEDQCQPRECYLFSDPACPDAPVLLHFPLVNDSFKSFSAPGEAAPPLLPQPGALNGARPS